ncbi:MAG: type II toxin-antitoxin system RelE/ParE family toxin [Ferruginibacter sp.]|nr:type II toxin-antitoxin system RelE/ParE family toxin [Ferruginibacter sp.]
MAKYHLTHKAVKDLSNIWNYTCNEWSEMQADEYYQLLMHTFTKLANEPKIGKNYDEISLDLLGYKFKNHIIFYQAISDTEILIIRILHSRMDLKSRIND